MPSGDNRADRESLNDPSILALLRGDPTALAAERYRDAGRRLKVWNKLIVVAAVASLALTSVVVIVAALAIGAAVATGAGLATAGGLTVTVMKEISKERKEASLEEDRRYEEYVQVAQHASDERATEEFLERQHSHNTEQILGDDDAKLHDVLLVDGEPDHRPDVTEAAPEKPRTFEPGE